MDQSFCVLFRQVLSKPSQIVQVVRGRVACSCSVSRHCEFCIEPWAQVPRRWHGSNCWVTNTETGNSYFSELLGCTNDQNSVLSSFSFNLSFNIQLRLSSIQLSILAKATSWLINTSIGAEGQIKLAVICITMGARQMFVHDWKNLARIRYKR